MRLSCCDIADVCVCGSMAWTTILWCKKKKRAAVEKCFCVLCSCLGNVCVLVYLFISCGMFVLIYLSISWDACALVYLLFSDCEFCVFVHSLNFASYRNSVSQVE